MTSPKAGVPMGGVRPGRRAYASGLAAIGLAVLIAALSGMRAPASAALAEGDQKCLLCHGTPGFEKELTDGTRLPLQIDGDHFGSSVHAALGCTGCHADVNLTSHPPAANPIASKRAFSIGMIQVCRTCHSDKFDQWSTSVHADLVKQGNPAAPICTSCHSPHTMLKGAAAAMDTVPCRTCHEPIFTAYAASVHGVLRSGGVTQAPLCFSCHGAHDVRVPSAGAGRRDVCLACHTEAIASHRKWLPNVDLHFGAVSCPVCHSPKAHRVVDLILYNSATQKETPEPVGVPRFERLPGEAAKQGLDAGTLMTLLTTLNSQGTEGKTAIRGRLEVSTGIEDHQLALASEAIGDCAACHQKGAAAFQSVVVSVAGPAGIPIRYDANKEVLNSALSIDSIGGFYAIGATRITLLDVLLTLAVLGGFAWPFGHLLVRWVVGRYLDLTIPHDPN